MPTSSQRFKVIQEDVPWSCPDGKTLLARVYRPSAIEGAPVLVNIHGGAWSSGDRTQADVYGHALAEAGCVVASIDFRDGRVSRHPSGTTDALNGVRYARLHAEGWGGSPQSLGLIGSSSGGHIALLAATHPAGSEESPLPPIVDVDGQARVRADVDPSVAYVVGLWPVSDPHYRYRYAKRAGLTRLAEGGTSYFGDEAMMRTASVPRVVVAGEATQLPPALVVQPGEDSNVPIEMTFDLLRAWQSRAGHIEYAHFPDQPHGFGGRASAETTNMVALVRDFVARFGPR
ncbi:MAG: alpha/beta hydrolase [Chloroflexi bacterium]|nr:MAG: alpha/beta hydrolase [Chloroflexota bacterium]